MKKSSIVLATLVLTASFLGLGRPAAAQSLASQVTLTTNGYDPTITTAALVAATAPTSDATALLAAVNAVRYSNGVPQLALDPSLAGAATYQVQDQVNLSFSGSYAYTSRGQVTAPQMATDFGSVAAGVQEYSFGNGFFPGDTGNWTALVGDWENKDISFANMVNDPSVNVGGLGLVNVGGIVKWTLIVGYNAAATVASVQTVSVSRLYISSNGDHFYTASAADVQAAERTGYTPESVIGYAPAAAGPGTTTVYCLFYSPSGEHFYTTSSAEATIASNLGYHLTSTAFQVLMAAGPNTVPIYRFYWPAGGKHFFTTSQAEYNIVMAAGFNFEGIVGYLYASPPAVATGPALNLTGLNATLAQQAMAAAPTTDETAFLAAINAYRASLGVQPLRMESALHSTAYYKTHGTGSDAASTLAIDFGSLHSTFVASSNGTGSLFYGYTLGYYGDWTDICNLLASYDHTAQPVFSDGSYSHVGISIVDAGVKQVSPLDNLPYEVYNWTIVLGK